MATDTSRYKCVEALEKLQHRVIDWELNKERRQEQLVGPLPHPKVVLLFVMEVRAAGIHYINITSSRCDLRMHGNERSEEESVH